MDAAGPRVFGTVCTNETRDFGDDMVEVPRLATGRRRERVAVHRIARPDHGMAGVVHRAQQWAQFVFDVVGTHPRDQGEASGDACRVQHLAQLENELGRRRRADLAADGVTDPAQELDVCAVELTGALADPQHVGRTVVPVAGQRVAASEGLFVSENQCLVRGEHVDLMEGRVVLGVDAACAHEGERVLDFGGQCLVTLSFGRRLDEFLRPGVHAVEVCEPALGEGS